MSITYRKLTEEDLDTFIRMRITQLREEGATENVDLVQPLTDYYHRHLADGTFVSWLALDEGQIVGTSGMLIGYACVQRRGTRLSQWVESLAFFPYLMPAMSFGTIYLAVATSSSFTQTNTGV